jgi:dimethylamine monooxygenase subunit A
MSVPYVPLDKRGHRLVVGTRPLQLDKWLEVDSSRVSELATKQDLNEKLDQVFQQLEQANPAVVELFELISSHIEIHYKSLFRVVREHGHTVSIFDCETQAKHEVDFGNCNRLLILGAIFQEDFCVMQKVNSDWLLTAAVLYSPSRWSLLEKIGKNLDGIHKPVPEYAEKLGRAVEMLFDRITVDEPVWRANWTVLDDPTNFQPSPPTPGNRKRLENANLGRELYFRVERQTLVRLPNSDAVIFTIRTYVNTLAELLAADPSHRELLATAIETTTEDHADYRGWEYIKPALQAYLKDSMG